MIRTFFPTWNFVCCMSMTRQTRGPWPGPPLQLQIPRFCLLTAPRVAVDLGSPHRSIVVTVIVQEVIFPPSLFTRVPVVRGSVQSSMHTSCISRVLLPCYDAIPDVMRLRQGPVSWIWTEIYPLRCSSRSNVEGFMYLDRSRGTLYKSSPVRFTVSDNSVTKWT